MRAIALSLILVAGAALADEPVPVQAQALCDGQKLIGVRVIAPFPGIITIPMPDKPCEARQEKPAPPQKRPARTA